MNVRSFLAALIGLVMVGSASAWAQSFPDKPVRIVVGFAAGSLVDQAARTLADYMARETGQQVTVENRAGAAGTIGIIGVTKAAPDGYTLGVLPSGVLVINPFVQKDIAFDTFRDLVPVAAIGEAPQTIVINADVPAKTLKEFIALAKSKPKALNYGSAGPGSLPHLSANMFMRMAGIELTHVPYRGMAPATTDLMGGRVQLISSSIGGLQGPLEAKKVRMLLTATKERLSYLPDVPSAAEAGLPGFEVGVWVGVVAPAGTPKPVVDRINALVRGMVKESSSQKRLALLGLELMNMDQPQFADFVKAEHARWGRIVREAGVEPQ